jgi:hypothetical protein
MSGLPDTILKGGHQRTKQSLVPIGAVVSEMKIFKISSPFLFLVTATMLVGGGFKENIFSKKCLVIVYGRTTDAK